MDDVWLITNSFFLESISAPVIKSIDVINSTSVRIHWKVPDEYKNIDDKLKIGFQVSYAFEVRMHYSL